MVFGIVCAAVRKAKRHLDILLLKEEGLPVFVISKLLSAITQPLFWLGLWWTVALCLLGRAPVAARRMLWAGLVVLVALGFQAGPDALLRPLEDRFEVPHPQAVPQHHGVIVLGGALGHPDVANTRGHVPLGGAAERMTVPVGWMHQHPKLQLIFSGGEGRLLPTGTTEGAMAAQFYTEQGVDMRRVTIESGSRTTRENAQRVAELLGPRCREGKWLLVTSAWHMARSVPEFEAVGCNVTPYPVDFRTGSATAWTEYSLAKSLWRWQMALHEWIGQLAYSVTR